MNRISAQHPLFRTNPKKEECLYTKGEKPVKKIPKTYEAIKAASGADVKPKGIVKK